MNIFKALIIAINGSTDKVTNRLKYININNKRYKIGSTIHFKRPVVNRKNKKQANYGTITHIDSLINPEYIVIHLDDATDSDSNEIISSWSIRFTKQDVINIAV